MKKNAFWCPVIFGIALIILGCVIKIPGTALTTHSTLDGAECTSDYFIGDRYSAIDEYVGGDAYNYIIGASLVAGKISGTITAKAICVVAGVLCVCAGCTMWMMNSQRTEIKKTSITSTENKTDESTAAVMQNVM